MFKELFHSTAPKRENWRYSDNRLNGTFVGTFLGVSSRRAQVCSLVPDYDFKDVFVFEFEVFTQFGAVEVGKWVERPPVLCNPPVGRDIPLYNTLAQMRGVEELTDEQLDHIDEFINECVGKEFNVSLHTRPTGWVEVTYISPR